MVDTNKTSAATVARKESSAIQSESPAHVLPAEHVQKEAVVMSQKDSLVADLVKDTRAVSDLEGLSLKTLATYNPLALPEECEALHKKQYRFRWLALDKFLEAKLRQGLWLLCTRANCPFIKPHRFKTHGAVEQAGMLLAFTTERLAQWREQQPAKKSAALVKHYTEDLAKNEEEGFYKPKDSGVDEEESGGFEMTE